MKKSNPMKIMPLLISIVSAGCAGTSAESVLSTVDHSLATVGQTAQTGRAVIEAGKTAAAGVPASQSSLTNVLVSQLGVTQQQALGGAGAIFQVAKDNMAQQAFTTLSQSTPGINDMLAAAPQASQPISGATSVLGSMGNTVNSMTTLASSFQQLNLSPSMVNQFIPVILDYVRNTSGQMTASLLESALMTP
jgi:hypothetical protein